MSDLKFSCPHCKQHLEGPEELLGRVEECPLCGQHFQVQKSELRQVPQAVSQNVNVEIKRGASPLELPAKNFDGEGMVRFEIPSTMITR